MSNQYDLKYKEIKNKVSKNIGEITSIWNCGIDNRINAFKNNIKSWKNPDVNHLL